MADQQKSPQSPSTELATEQAPATLAADLKSLREDLATLRSDLGSDMSTLTKDLRRLAQDTAGLVRETTGTLAGRGRQTVETVQHRVEERPLSTLLLSLGAGLVAGMMLTRGGSPSGGSSGRFSASVSPSLSSSWRSSRGLSGTGRITGTRDEDYDLISLLYHLTKGAWEYDGYAQDAERSGDHQLAELFREAQQQHQQLAERAKRLLKERLG